MHAHHYYYCTLILKHGYVPDSFGYGISIPLIKKRQLNKGSSVFLASLDISEAFDEVITINCSVLF